MHYTIMAMQIAQMTTKVPSRRTMIVQDYQLPTRVPYPPTSYMYQSTIVETCRNTDKYSFSHRCFTFPLLSHPSTPNFQMHLKVSYLCYLSRHRTSYSTGRSIVTDDKAVE